MRANKAVHAHIGLGYVGADAEVRQPQILNGLVAECLVYHTVIEKLNTT